VARWAQATQKKLPETSALYKRGYRAERELRERLSALGFFCVRAAGSRGPIDLVAISPQGKEVWLIQVKKTRQVKQRRAWQREAEQYFQDVKAWVTQPQIFFVLAVRSPLGWLFIRLPEKESRPSKET